MSDFLKDENVVLSHFRQRESEHWFIFKFKSVSFQIYF